MLKKESHMSLQTLTHDIYIYVSPQIVTGPVLELGRPVLELGRSSPHTGTVPIWGAPYWNWIQDRGFVPKRGVQCWNWASSAGTGRLSCNPDLSPAPYWHWCQYGAPHFGRRIRVGGVWQFFWRVRSDVARLHERRDVILHALC